MIDRGASRSASFASVNFVSRSRRSRGFALRPGALK
jgi:hypothetical protein